MRAHRGGQELDSPAQNLLKSIQTDCRIWRKGKERKHGQFLSRITYEIASKPLILFILFQLKILSL